MNALPDAYAEFGQTLAFTERTMTAVLRNHLAERGVEPETWYALKLVAAGAPHLDRSSLLRDLEGSPRIGCGLHPGRVGPIWTPRGLIVGGTRSSI